MSESRPFKFEEFITTVFGVDDPQPETRYEAGHLRAKITKPLHPLAYDQVWRYLQLRIGEKYVDMREVDGDAGTWAEFIINIFELGVRMGEKH